METNRDYSDGYTIFKSDGIVSMDQTLVSGMNPLVKWSMIEEGFLIRRTIL